MDLIAVNHLYTEQEIEVPAEVFKPLNILVKMYIELQLACHTIKKIMTALFYRNLNILSFYRKQILSVLTLDLISLAIMT